MINIPENFPRADSGSDGDQRLTRKRSIITEGRYMLGYRVTPRFLLKTHAGLIELSALW
jgi:hypothetical protein